MGCITLSEYSYSAPHPSSSESACLAPEAEGDQHCRAFVRICIHHGLNLVHVLGLLFGYSFVFCSNHSRVQIRQCEGLEVIGVYDLVHVIGEHAVPALHVLRHDSPVV